MFDQKLKALLNHNKSVEIEKNFKELYIDPDE